MMKAGMGLAAAATVALLVTGTAASAQELSDKSVKTFMDYAWSLVPAKFTKPDGKTVEIDKKKKDEVLVPIDAAREVIRVARLSAHAQVCDLAEDQVNNYRSMMKRETDKKKWSEQQMIYINQLHLTTVMLLTGKIKLIEKEGDKEVVVEEGKNNNQSCTPEQKAKVKEVIAAYVKAGPPISTGPAAPVGAQQPTAGAAPAPAPAAAPAAPAPATKK